MLCSKPRLFRRVTRYSCEDFDACFRPQRLRLRLTRFQEKAPQPFHIRIKTHIFQLGLDKSVMYGDITQI